MKPSTRKAVEELIADDDTIEDGVREGILGCIQGQEPLQSPAEVAKYLGYKSSRALLIAVDQGRLPELEPIRLSPVFVKFEPAQVRALVKERKSE